MMERVLRVAGSEMLSPGFEPGSMPREGIMIGQTTLRELSLFDSVKYINIKS